MTYNLNKPLTKLINNWRNRKPKVIKPKLYLTENGSLLPNRFARWRMPFDKLIDKDL